jgi:hypothetical protein
MYIPARVSQQMPAHLPFAGQGQLTEQLPGKKIITDNKSR